MSPRPSSTACTRPARRRGSRCCPVTGTNGKTTTVAHDRPRAAAGRACGSGMACTDGVYRRRTAGSCRRRVRARGRPRWCSMTRLSRQRYSRRRAAASSAAGSATTRPTSRSSPTSPPTTSATTAIDEHRRAGPRQGAGRRGDPRRRVSRAQRRRSGSRRRWPSRPAVLRARAGDQVLQPDAWQSGAGAAHKAAGGACYEVIDAQLTETEGGRAAHLARRRRTCRARSAAGPLTWWRMRWLRSRRLPRGRGQRRRTSARAQDLLSWNG